MVSVGDVILGDFFPKDGITPKNGELSRTKMFVVLGKDPDGCLICGVVINSDPRVNIESQYPITPKFYSFLSHNSFVNCDNLLSLESERAESYKKIGEIISDDLELIRKTVISSKLVKGKLKKKFCLFESFIIDENDHI